MLVPFVPTFLGSGFGFAQCSQSLGEGYPICLPHGRLAGRRRRTEGESGRSWGVMSEEQTWDGGGLTIR